jgi:hypothetical protein
MNENENWFSRGKAEAEKGIPSSERFVGISIVVFIVFLLLYLNSQQTHSTRLFTPTIRTPEIVMFYCVLIMGIISAGLEGVFGQRFYSRLFDVFGGLILAAVCTIGLLVVFPFEFAHFADVMPDSLSFLVRWISNDIARVLMVLAIIVYIGAAAYCPIAYKFVETKRSRQEKTSV